VMEEGRKAGIPVPALEGFQQAMEKATGEAIDPAAERLESYAGQNDAKVASQLAAVPAPGRAAKQLEGYLMDEKQNAEKPNNTRRDILTNEWTLAAASLPILGLLLAWRWKRRHNQ
jgi:hypothetical protein